MASKSSKKTVTVSSASSVVQSAHSTSSSASPAVATPAAAAAAVAAAAAGCMATPPVQPASASLGVNHGVHGTQSSSSRPSSPLSPTRLTRVQEKEALGHLNDRLAAYIDRVRQLELENRNLLVQVKTSEETSTREVTNIKTLFEGELAEARRILDDTAKDKASLQINCGKFQIERDEALAKLSKKEKDLVAAEKNALFYESKTHDLQGRLSQCLAEKKKSDDDNKELKAEMENMSVQLTTARHHLEKETLARIDMENRAQSLREELNFKEQMHEKELIETRTRKQVEISEIDGQLQEQYDQRLCESLAELRSQYEAQMRKNREEIEVMFDTKIEDQTRMNEQTTRNLTLVREELMQAKSHASTFETKLSDLETRNLGLLSRIKDLERMLEDERHHHHNVVSSKETEIAKLRDEIANQLKDYQDLMGIKIGLDVEIAAYHSLLQGEEHRLNLTPVRESSSGRRSAGRGTPSGTGRNAKRRRTYLSNLDESTDFASNKKATGDVEIHDQDTDGKFIKIHNKGANVTIFVMHRFRGKVSHDYGTSHLLAKDINIGGWQLVRKSGDQTTTHKFHRSIVIKAGAYITVWSSDSEVTHSPPSDLVMKSQKWSVGSNIQTHLIDSSGADVASMETFRQVQSAASYRSSSVLEGFRLGQGEVGYEEIYHQQGDPQNQDKCVLM